MHISVSSAVQREWRERCRLQCKNDHNVLNFGLISMKMFFVTNVENSTRHWILVGIRCSYRADLTRYPSVDMQFKVVTAVPCWQIWLTPGDSSLIPDVLTRLHKLDTPHYFECCCFFVYPAVCLFNSRQAYFLGCLVAPWATGQFTWPMKKAVLCVDTQSAQKHWTGTCGSELKKGGDVRRSLPYFVTRSLLVSANNQHSWICNFWITINCLQTLIHVLNDY